MKYLYIALTLASFALPFQVMAAKLDFNQDLGKVELTSSVPFDAQVDEGSFEGTFNFTTDPDIKNVTVNIATVSIFGPGKIDGFEAILDGNKTDVDQANFDPLAVQFLLGQGNAGVHTLVIKGNVPAGGASFSGSISATTVPVPAAVWLFGSALSGLFGVKRRKQVAYA